MITLKSKTLKTKFVEYSKYVLKDGYEINEKTKPFISKIFSTFEEGNFGIIVYGGTGTGKTVLFDILQKVIHPKDKLFFRKKNALDVVLDFNINGHDAFRDDSNHSMFYDDLGTEEIGYRYGEKVEVFEKLIQLRYDIYRSKGLRTYFTTNLNSDEVEVRYGFRCWSRLREMCQHVVLHDNDKRAKRNFLGLPTVLHPTILTQEDAEWEKMYNAHRENAKSKPREAFKTLGQKAKEKYGVSEKIMDEFNKQVNHFKNNPTT